MGSPISASFSSTFCSSTKFNKCKFIPFSSCSHHNSPKDLILRKPNSAELGILGLKVFLGRSGFVTPSWSIAAVDKIHDDAHFNEEVNKPNNFLLEEQSDLHVQKVNQLQNRIVYGLGIGISVGGIVLAGGWVFTVALAAAVFAGSREYFDLVRSRGIAAGMTPPPRYVSRVCSVICALMPVLTLYFGHIDVSVTSAAFVVAMALLLQKGIPRFSQLSSTMFGLFYCGYLPCFWVKLRCGLATPSLYTRVAAAWPILLGGHTQWTVGLVATLISISSIVAADTYAFVGGKAFGRTPLTVISPKKTWEGALAGLGGCILTTLLLSKILSWPSSVLSAIAFGFLNFFGSLFGDLIESLIKRDAGVKDSGSLIPGHGNNPTSEILSLLNLVLLCK
ncbi:transferase [Lithospermum erythrorhizon]|uniref:phosphatidate cytidylyltransferase n=1 Tax=Lithospermum erythrorhizon TaxID=34254 RepID=A0AAV3S3I1_LITER